MATCLPPRADVAPSGVPYGYVAEALMYEFLGFLIGGFIVGSSLIAIALATYTARLAVIFFVFIWILMGTRWLQPQLNLRVVLTSGAMLAYGLMVA